MKQISSREHVNSLIFYERSLCILSKMVAELQQSVSNVLVKDVEDPRKDLTLNTEYVAASTE